jgi:SAM-dependent methyltransferase
VRLPFKDESFDLVLSLAVTEHVKQPWILAEEIKRVTTRGGTIHVDSAFMQPLHGYPSHYFNMTRFALREIFQGIEIGSLKPAPYQHPWFSISWILDRLLIDLPQDQREMLGRMTVELFLDELRKFCNGQPNQLAAVQLSEAKIEELAAGFTLIGTRP